MVQTIFSIQVNTATAEKQIVWINEKIEVTDRELKKLETRAKKRLNSVIHSAQLMWGVIQGVIRAAGGSISMTTRLVVTAGFGAVQTLGAIMSAGGAAALVSGNPVLLAQAIFGMVQLGTAIAALVAYEQQQRDISFQLRGATFMVQNLSSLVYGWL